MKFKHNRTMLISIMLPLLIGIFCIGSNTFSTSASPSKSQAANVREKQVISFVVEENDTLWSIAEQYYTEECGSMKEYIDEIKQCNSLTEDTIYAGYPLLIPTWVSNLKTQTLDGTDHL